MSHKTSDKYAAYRNNLRLLINKKPHMHYLWYLCLNCQCVVVHSTETVDPLSAASDGLATASGDKQQNICQNSCKQTLV